MVTAVIRYYVLKIKNGKSLETNRIPNLSWSTMIRSKSGRIIIKGSCHTYGRVYISAVNKGTILLGNNCFINQNCIFVARQSIVIGDNVLFGPNVIMYDHDHSYGYDGINVGIYKCADIVIEDNCWIGAGAIILRGTHIGAGSVIGAGCIVKGVIPAHSLVTSERTLTIKKIENQ